MINTNYRQGRFKKYDELIIIDPCNRNDWKIVWLGENYGITRDINVVVFYDFGEKCTKVRKIDTNFIDIFFHVYKIVREYEYD